MNWLKRYAISCLVALLLLSINDGYGGRPGRDTRIGSLLTMAAAWPVTAVFVVGTVAGETLREMRQEKLG